MTATKFRMNRSTEDFATSISFSEARLTTGVKLRYAEQGSVNGQPVIFLHGYTDSWFSFSRVFPYFDATYRLFALDQRGHGESEQPAGAYRMTDFAADVIGFMDALEIEKATLVGHSMGSFVARAAATRASERVSKLVLVGSATTVLNEGMSELQRAVEQLKDPVPEEFAREFQESTIYRPLPDDFMRRVIQESLKLPANVWRAVLRGLTELDDASSLGEIRAPALILWGDRDSIFSREEQNALACALQNAVLKVYEETGHALHWERPERFIEDLKDFMRAAE